MGEASADSVCCLVELNYKPRTCRKEEEHNLALYPPNTCGLENSSAEIESVINTISEGTGSWVMANHSEIVTPPICSNVAILIPDFVEVQLSQQAHHGSKPEATLTGGGGELPVTDPVSHCDVCPMTRTSNPVAPNWLGQSLWDTPTPTVRWNLNITKSVVIIGHSNLSRILPFRDDEIQIDSFPGTKLYYIYEILKKLRPNTGYQPARNF